jgi:hypothetical protein
MKRTIAVFFLLALLIQGCSSLKSVSEKEQTVNRVRASMEVFNFTFEARSAHSLHFNVIQLSPGYTLRVTKDTLEAYLPYYGQAYTTPMSPTEGGIKFISTKFERKWILVKKPDHWKITFKTLDNITPMNLFLEIWDNGTANLNVNDPNRQSISFEGQLIL